MVTEYFLNERRRNSSWERKHRLKIVMSNLSPLLYPCVIMAIIFFAIGVLDRRLPKAVSITDIEGGNGHLFSAEKTYNKLSSFTETIGPRVTGSRENEFDSVVFLLQEIDEATRQLTTAEKARVLVNVQHSNGWYYLDRKPHGQISIYEGIQNIVVKLQSITNSSSSLLINCHYDTVPVSPGASDDGVNCMIMIEILRALSDPNAPHLQHNVIFLFNGNEESQLQGSHAFITQHEWAKEVKAFINLEAAGAGAKELLFQSGPGNSWLIKAYTQSVPYPNGNSIVQEIFQSGFIPSETDFRIFRDFGNIPGLDFAYTRNGYVYHTRYDDKHRIPLGTVQHTGSNILALIPQLMSSPEFTQENKTDDILSSVPPDDQAVYFDVLGLFIVNYSDEVAIGINVGILFLSVVMIFGTVYVGLSFGSRDTRFWKIITGAGKAVAGWIIGAALVFVSATILDAVGHPMPWFRRPILIFPLFYIPTLVGCIIPYILPPQCMQKCKSCDSRSWENVYMDILGVQLIWTIVLLVCIIVGTRSTFIIAPLVLFPVLSHGIVLLWNRWKSTDKGWVILNQIFYLPSTAFIFSYTIMAFAVFVPISARMGSAINPSFVIGLIAVPFCIMVFAHIVPLIQLYRATKVILFCMIGIYILMMLVVTLTPIGFPFSNNHDDPTPQRAQVFHVRSRQYVFGQYYPVEQENFFWLLDWDRNGAKFSLKDADSLGVKKVLPESCDKVLFCGLPVYRSNTIKLLPHTHKVVAPEPSLTLEAELQLLSRISTESAMNITFSITGGSHLALGISPEKDVKLQSWNYGRVPKATYHWQGNRPVYYLYHAKGIASGEPWTVWIDLEVNPDTEYEFVVDVALIAHYNFGAPAETATEIVNQTLGPVAPWADLVAWPSSYDGWKF